MILSWDSGAPSQSMVNFSKSLGELAHPTPWHTSENNCGVIIDANGDTVAVVDCNSSRADEDAYAIAMWVVTAVNTCAGFVPVLITTGH